MKSAGKARNNGLYRHIRTSKEIIRNLLNDSLKNLRFASEICFNINVNTHNLLTFGFGGVKCVII